MLREAFDANYIAVEGVIGVGKTTFARMLAERLRAELLNEEVFENPFLVDFYKSRKRFGFSCQLYFLISRFQQQQQLMVRDLFAILARDIPRPDLVIYLQASTATLLERIRKRNFTFEKAIDRDYIEVLNKAYDYYFFNYTDTPLLVVKTDNIDFVNNPEHFNDLIEQISKPVSGKKYYAPSGDLTRS